jgi:hypothetical protein
LNVRGLAKEESGMSRILHGKVNGRTIEFDEDLGMAEGQAVEVEVKIAQPAKKWGEGILRSAGGWADHPEMDAIMEKIHQERKLERRTPQEGG